jgi:ParB/RepB/Spo0J family partition protein
MTDRKKTTRKLTKLKEYPRQREIFGDLPEYEIAALADDMKKNGLQHPVEILPDGTIVAGHQRVAAARRLGWREIDVIVRHDLADAGSEAIETYFIGDNLHRRQLSPLGRARCIQAMIEADPQHRWDRDDHVKTEIGKRLGISTRTINRYLLVLAAPAEIQQAFDVGEITLVNAGRIALLPQKQQRQAAERIASGESAKAVVAEYLHGGPHHDNLNRSYLRLIGALDREVPLLADRIPDIPRNWIVRWAVILGATHRLLADLLRRIESGDGE